MKKKLIGTLLGTFSLGLLLVGCGKTETPSAPPADYHFGPSVETEVEDEMIVLDGTEEDEIEIPEELLEADFSDAIPTAFDPDAEDSIPEEESNEESEEPEVTEDETDVPLEAPTENEETIEE